MKFQKRQNTAAGSRPVVAKDQRWGRQGDVRNLGRESVTEMFHTMIAVMATPLHAFVKTQNWPRGMGNHTAYKSNLNEAGKNLGRLEFEVPMEKW